MANLKTFLGKSFVLLDYIPPYTGGGIIRMMYSEQAFSLKDHLCLCQENQIIRHNAEA